MKFLEKVKSKISSNDEVEEVEEDDSSSKQLDPFDEYENEDTDVFSALLPKPKKRTKIDEVVEVLQGDELRDVLDYMQIPADTELPRDVLVVEDFPKIVFDEQAPVGYEEGQVDTFKNQAEGSIAYYVKLVDKKNHDIAMLATVVDKLQVSLNNLKVDQEITSGINIMATSNYEDLESKYQSSLVRIRELEAHVKNLENGNVSTAAVVGDEELLRKLEQWRDAYSVLQRDNEVLTEENDELRTRCNYLEEMADEVPIDQPMQNDESSLVVPEDEEPFPFEEFIEKVEEVPAVPTHEADQVFYVSVDDEDDEDDPFAQFMKESK